MLLFAHHQEVKQVRQVLFPPMMCAAAANGDIRSLESLHDQVRGHVTMGRLPSVPQSLFSSDLLCLEEIGHCILPYIRDQILELVNESLLVAVL